METRYVLPTLQKELSLKCVLSIKLVASDNFETVGRNDTTVFCTKTLRSEFEKYDFSMI